MSTSKARVWDVTTAAGQGMTVIDPAGEPEQELAVKLRDQFGAPVTLSEKVKQNNDNEERADG